MRKDDDQPLTLNDFDDIDAELKKDTIFNISKKKFFIILGICIFSIIIVALIIILLLTIKDKSKNSGNSEDEKTSKNKSEIICTYYIDDSYNITILNQQFSVPKFFDILIDNKIIQFSRY